MGLHFLTETRIGRARFFFFGLFLFLVKHNIDRLVALAYGQRFMFWEYWQPDPILGSAAVAASAHGGMFRMLLFFAVPFIIIGVWMTWSRLRDAGLSPWLTLIFFFPFINLLLFACLSAVPSRDESDPFSSFLDQIIPYGETGAIAAGLLGSITVSLALTWLSTNFFRGYGWGVFVGVPFMSGFIASAVLNFRRDQGIARTLAVAIGSQIATGLCLFGLAVEGIICLLMAVPIAIPLAILGAILGRAICRPSQPRPVGIAMSALLLVVPGTMGMESLHKERPLLAVETTIFVQSPPERVWQHVVTFSKLPEPEEALFKTGIAYPKEATITGSGVGAVRYCTFTTGSFVEPITAWDAPRRLAFGVASQPAVMQEWSYKRDLVPPHVSDAYLRSRRGEFVLIPANGGTILKGTTWYELRFWPNAYWQLWSDAVIHRIHLRVLNHVKRLAEADVTAPR